MRGSYRMLVMPALLGAALALTTAGFAAPAAAADHWHHTGAASWHHGNGGHSWHRGGRRSSWHHGGWGHRGEWSRGRHDWSWHTGWRHRPGEWRHGRSHHRRHFRDGLVHLPTLPILIEEAPHKNFRYERSAYRAPGVPNAVPYVHAGQRFADHGGAYVSSFYGGYGTPDWLAGSGTYAGDIEAVRDPGNGTYIAAYGYPDVYQERRVLAPAPKIIHVTPETIKAACHMEAGVCVIRP
ncbi:MAG TPA: hypothetical protein VFJ18_03135 [Pararhizobium sp.]|nr:hypothetical protein [Pararhizobium sp.]